MDKEILKQEIQDSLINSFIENKSAIDKEMNLLNILISSFGGLEYTYDEYCSKRIEFELDACDKAVDVDIDKELTISAYERFIIQNNAASKVMNSQEIEFEEALKEEYIKWQTNKCFDLDKKMFYQISNFSSIKLLRNKIPEEIWQNKHQYFIDICKNKALKHAAETAEANRGMHEQYIRSSMH